MTKVLQCDREAAASGYYAWVSGNTTIPLKMKTGQSDEHSIVQAFARHREEAQAELLEALKSAHSFILNEETSGFGDAETRLWNKVLDQAEKAMRNCKGEAE